jgi:RimJ/RimL family protein N-acetyltransferase
MNPISFTLKDGREAILRSIAPQDAERIIAFVQAADTESRFLAREPGEFSMSLEQERDFIRAKLEDTRSLWLVAELDGRIIASCNAGPARNLQRFRHRALLSVAVGRAYWRQGLGRRMMAEALRWCEANGFEQAELDVAADNDAATAMYESMGFETTGVYKNGFKYPDGTYSDEYFMWLPLRKINKLSRESCQEPD